MIRYDNKSRPQHTSKASLLCEIRGIIFDSQQTTAFFMCHSIKHELIIIIIINDNVYSAVIVTMVTARVHPVHLMNAD